MVQRASLWAGFRSFLEFTGDAYPMGIRDAIHELALARYTTMGDVTRGKPMHRIVQNGASIVTPIELSLSGDYRSYNPGEPISWHDTQTGYMTQSHWRLERGTAKWNRAELQQQATGTFDYASRVQTYQRVYDLKVRQKKTYMANYIERAFWAAGNATKMESPNGTGLLVKSFPSGVNEWTAAEHGVAGDGLFPGYTTFQGLNPNQFLDPEEVASGVANPRSLWAPRKVTYTDLGNAETDTAGHFVEQATRMLELLQFDPVPMAGDLSEPRGGLQKYVYTDLEGILAYQRTVRAHFDLFGNKGSQDLYHNPMFAGIKFRRVAVLDNNPLYPSVAAGAATAYTRAPVTAGDPDGIIGPRYYFIDPEYVDCIWDEELYFADSEVYRLKETAPDTFVMLTENQRTMHFYSRQRHGILCPANDISGTYGYVAA